MNLLRVGQVHGPPSHLVPLGPCLLSALGTAVHHSSLGALRKTGPHLPKLAARRWILA